MYIQDPLKQTKVKFSQNFLNAPEYRPSFENLSVSGLTGLQQFSCSSASSHGGQVPVRKGAQKHLHILTRLHPNSMLSPTRVRRPASHCLHLCVDSQASCYCFSKHNNL